MSRLPAWAQGSIIAAGVLLSPVLAFLMALAVAILIGILKDAGAPAFLALIVAGATGWIVFRKLRMRPRGGASVGT